MTIYCCLTLTNSSLSAQQLEIYLNARLSEIARFSSANRVVVNEELKLYWELYQVIKRAELSQQYLHTRIIYHYYPSNCSRDSFDYIEYQKKHPFIHIKKKVRVQYLYY